MCALEPTRICRCKRRTDVKSGSLLVCPVACKKLQDNCRVARTKVVLLSYGKAPIFESGRRINGGDLVKCPG